MIGAALKAARLQRKKIADINEAHRDVVLHKLWPSGRADHPWEYYPDPDYDDGVANRALRLGFSTRLQHNNTPAVFVVLLIFRDGEHVDFYNFGGERVTTAATDQVIDVLARLIAEFEWPNEKPV